MTTTPDYAALAAQAERDHRGANERYQESSTASSLAAFRQVVFSAAAAGVTQVELHPSDQDDHMSLSDVTPTELHTSELDNDLWDGVSDLTDYPSADWAGQPGVEATLSPSHDQITSATIDIKVAAEALLADARAETEAEKPAISADDIRELVAAIDGIVRAWEGGDLAGAVNNARETADQYRTV